VLLGKLFLIFQRIIWPSKYQELLVLSVVSHKTVLFGEQNFRIWICVRSKVKKWRGTCSVDLVERGNLHQYGPSGLLR
jgi:hypothetical protein